MAARVPLVKSGSATSGPTGNGLNKSQLIHLADPPYIFEAPGTWTGSITIQQSFDTFPEQQGWFAGSPGGGVPDSSATWETIITMASGSGPYQWDNPLYRIRANTSGVTGSATPDVYRLEGIRTLTGDSKPKQKQKGRQG